MTFRASGGTFVNRQGLVEKLENLSDDKVINGDFATDSDWNKASNWSISSGKANADGTSLDALTQTLPFAVVGKTYQLKYTISNYTSGNIRVYYGGVFTNYVSSNGEYSIVITATSTASVFQTSMGVAFNGSIDNISVQEVTSIEGTPRIDFLDDSDGALLLEPQRTNLITDSEAFSDSSWNPSNATAISSNEVNPSGDSYTYKVNSNVGSTVNSTFIFGVLSGLTPSVAHSYSVFAKKGGYDGIKVLFDDGSDLSNNAQAIFNLNDGSIASIQAIGTFSGVTAKAEDFGNGWYRCTVSSVISSTGGTRARIYNSDTTITVGDGTKGAYLYGAQFEEGSYSTSYIPTYGTVSTRLQDTCTNGGNENVINSEEGVLFAEFSVLADDLSNRFISISNGTKAERVAIGYSNASNKIKAFSLVGNVTQSSLDFILPNMLDYNKIAFKYKLNDFSLWVNGVEVGTETVGSVSSPNILNELAFDEGDGTDVLYGRVKDVKVFDTALTDAELLTLTTI